MEKPEGAESMDIPGLLQSGQPKAELEVKADHTVTTVIDNAESRADAKNVTGDSDSLASSRNPTPVPATTTTMQTTLPPDAQTASNTIEKLVTSTSDGLKTKSEDTGTVPILEDSDDRSRETSALQEAESFLDSMVFPTGNDGVDPPDSMAFVKSPSEMHGSDEREDEEELEEGEEAMDIDTDEDKMEEEEQNDKELNNASTFARRRESQIWEGTFDNSSPSPLSRKRKRASPEPMEDHLHEGLRSEPLKFESPDIDVDVNAAGLFPGALAFAYGPPHPAIVTLTFDVDENRASAAARWSRRQSQNAGHEDTSGDSLEVNFSLQCISRTSVSNLSERKAALAPSQNIAELYSSAESYWSHLEEYSIWIECNDMSWTPNDITWELKKNKSSSLNITSAIKPGTNELKIVSLSTDASDAAFFVYMSTVTKAHRDVETEAKAIRQRREEKWSRLSALGRTIAVKRTLEATTMAMATPVPIAVQ